MTSTIRFSVLLGALALAGCITQPPRPVPLPFPARPTLPAVTGAELQCVAPDVYTRIVNRVNGYKTWGLELEAIIKTNNMKGGQAAAIAH